ncbi:IclR family transcriptional regulator C-terminal domain-containing protein [Rhodococcus sp. NPDC006774]|uniref:IclR family transcriptional regulator domain-containing protein n=1 Tax=Rhodococcus sp. NPDC006774 TaxID=3157186 RepID=UPI0033C663CE
MWRAFRRRVCCGSSSRRHSIPAHATSSGRVLLAALPESALEHYLAVAPIEALTPRSAFAQQQRHRRGGAEHVTTRE